MFLRCRLLLLPMIIAMTATGASDLTINQKPEKSSLLLPLVCTAALAGAAGYYWPKKMKKQKEPIKKETVEEEPQQLNSSCVLLYGLSEERLGNLKDVTVYDVSAATVGEIESIQAKNAVDILFYLFTNKKYKDLAAYVDILSPTMLACVTGCGKNRQLQQPLLWQLLQQSVDLKDDKDFLECLGIVYTKNPTMLMPIPVVASPVDTNRTVRTIMYYVTDNRVSASTLLKLIGEDMMSGVLGEMYKNNNEMFFDDFKFFVQNQCIVKQNEEKSAEYTLATIWLEQLMRGQWAFGVQQYIKSLSDQCQNNDAVTALKNIVDTTPAKIVYAI